jgi:predicted PurR-regulated permease PerM
MSNDGLQRVLIWLLIAAVAIYLLTQMFGLVQLLSSPLLLFGLAWLVALALRPLVDRFEALTIPIPGIGPRKNTSTRWQLPRSLAVTLTYLILLAVVVTAGFALAPVIGPQLNTLQGMLPTSVDQITASAAWAEAELLRLGVRVDLNRLLPPESIAQQAATLGSTLVQQTIGLAGGVAAILFDLTIVLILSFYMSLDGPQLMNRMLSLMPPVWQKNVALLLAIVDRTFGGFLRAQLLQGLIYGLANAVLMLALGLQYVALASLVAALLVLIPIIGVVLAMIPPLIVALIEAPDRALPIIIGLLIIQQVLFNVIMPRIMGQMVGLHPLLVFAGILVGGALAGVWGVLFGIPIAGVLASIGYFFYLRATGQSVEPLATANNAAPPTDERPIWPVVPEREPYSPSSGEREV